MCRVIEKGTKNWKEKRERQLAKLAPNFVAHGHKKAGDKLVSQCLEGNAWHADHIVPVYKGGGLCQLENLRTLCVPCHSVSHTLTHAHLISPRNHLMSCCRITCLSGHQVWDIQPLWLALH